jgi:hypothetical protein
LCRYVPGAPESAAAAAADDDDGADIDSLVAEVESPASGSGSVGFFGNLIAELGRLAGLPPVKRDRLAAASQERHRAERRALESRAEDAEVGGCTS